MKQKVVYVDSKKRHLAYPVEGSIQMTELTADRGKVLKNDSVNGEWLCIAVESTDGWYEIDNTPPDEENAEISDYENALSNMGVRFGD